jgi:hypothetical protein
MMLAKHSFVESLNLPLDHDGFLVVDASH